MEKIAEHFGVGFLALIAGVLGINIYFSYIAPGGVVNDIVRSYMDSICGVM
ncbi:MAG: hypothetical protein J6K53_10445 [Roseburia sp.]|nr:hypothetical protein [Roseburia sp.]